MKAHSSNPDQNLPFSDAYEANGLVFLSGCVALDENDEMVQDTIENETHQVMKNIGQVLEEIGLSYKNVVKAEIFITNLDQRAEISDAYLSYFEKPYPARANIEVSGLPLGANVEIVVVASRG